jgi:hypothetical protein
VSGLLKPGRTNAPADDRRLLLAFSPSSVAGSAVCSLHKTAASLPISALVLVDRHLGNRGDWRLVPAPQPVPMQSEPDYCLDEANLHVVSGGLI